MSKTNTHQRQAGRTAKNWVDYESLKAALSIDAVLAHYDVKLRGTGGQKSGFCPLPTHHSPAGKTTGKKSPSFSAHLSKSAWHCFGCGAKGNALELAVRLEGHDPDDPAEFRKGALAVRDAFGLDAGGPTRGPRTPQERRKPTDDAKPASKAKRRLAGRKVSHSRPPTSPPVVENHERVEEEEDAGVETLVNAPLDFELQHLDASHPYLAGRGFEPETVEHFGLGYCAKGLMKGRIAIPVRDEEGRLVAYAGRLVDEDADDAPKYRFPGPVERDGVRREFHKSLVLYHAHDLWPRRESLATLYVVEGFPACWHLWQMGLRDVVAVMGSSCSDAQATLLAELVRATHPGEPSGRLVLIPDGDAGGRQLAADLLPKLAPHAWCRVVELPNGTQPTDFDRDGLREQWK